MKNKIIINSYITISILFIFNIIIGFYDYSFYGYWTDKVIGWLWIVLTILVIIIFWKKRIAKIYLITLCLIIFLSIIPMLIPFFGILYFFTTMGDYERIELNKEFRIEITENSALSLKRVYVYKKMWILEKNICRPWFDDIEEEMRLNKSNSNKVESAKVITQNKDSIGIKYKIQNKSKIIYHKINNKDGY